MTIDFLKGSHKNLVISLSLMVILMFGFSFALVPIYSVFCKVTGLNGKVDTTQPGKFSYIASLYKLDNPTAHKRRIVVEFDTNKNKDLLCTFSPTHTALEVIPGELTETSYHIKNLSTDRMVIQSIPSISPGFVAKYLKKLECFCFAQQVLEPGQALDLPLRFWLEPEIPESIHRLTLSYTVFDVSAKNQDQKT